MNEFEALHSEAMRTQNEIIDQTIRNMKISPEEKDILKDFLDSQDINERPRLLYRIVNEVKK